MSADNYAHIKKAGSKYLLFLGFASSGHRTKRDEYSNLEDAIKAGQALHTEYGLTFDFGTELTDILATDSREQTKDTSRRPEGL